MAAFLLGMRGDRAMSVALGSGWWPRISEADGGSGLDGAPGDGGEKAAEACAEIPGGNIDFGEIRSRPSLSATLAWDYKNKSLAGGEAYD